LSGLQCHLAGFTAFTVEIPFYSYSGSGHSGSALSEVISYCWTCLVVLLSCRTFWWQWRTLLVWPLTGVEALHTVIPRSVVKYTDEEACRERENGFDLSMCELEPCIALLYVRALYGTNHPLHFLYNETCSTLIFSENMSRGRFLDNKSNRRCTGSGTDWFIALRIVF